MRIPLIIGVLLWSVAARATTIACRHASDQDLDKATEVFWGESLDDKGASVDEGRSNFRVLKTFRGKAQGTVTVSQDLSKKAETHHPSVTPGVKAEVPATPNPWRPWKGRNYLVFAGAGKNGPEFVHPCGVYAVDSEPWAAWQLDHGFAYKIPVPKILEALSDKVASEYVRTYGRGESNEGLTHDDLKQEIQQFRRLAMNSLATRGPDGDKALASIIAHDKDHQTRYFAIVAGEDVWRGAAGLPSEVRAVLATALTADADGEVRDRAAYVLAAALPPTAENADFLSATLVDAQPHTEYTLATGIRNPALEAAVDARLRLWAHTPGDARAGAATNVILNKLAFEAAMEADGSASWQSGRTACKLSLADRLKTAATAFLGKTGHLAAGKDGAGLYQFKVAKIYKGKPGANIGVRDAAHPGSISYDSFWSKDGVFVVNPDERFVVFATCEGSVCNGVDACSFVRETDADFATVSYQMQHGVFASAKLADVTAALDAKGESADQTEELRSTALRQLPRFGAAGQNELLRVLKTAKATGARAQAAALLWLAGPKQIKTATLDGLVQEEKRRVVRRETYRLMASLEKRESGQDAELARLLRAESDCKARLGLVSGLDPASYASFESALGGPGKDARIDQARRWLAKMDTAHCAKHP